MKEASSCGSKANGKKPRNQGTEIVGHTKELITRGKMTKLQSNADISTKNSSVKAMTTTPSFLQAPKKAA